MDRLMIYKLLFDQPLFDYLFPITVSSVVYRGKRCSVPFFFSKHFRRERVENVQLNALWLRCKHVNTRWDTDRYRTTV